MSGKFDRPVSGATRRYWELLMPMVAAFAVEIAVQARRDPRAPVTRTAMSRARRHLDLVRRVLDGDQPAGARPNRPSLAGTPASRFLPELRAPLMRMGDLSLILAETRAALATLGDADFDMPAYQAFRGRHKQGKTRDIDEMRRELSKRFVRLFKEERQSLIKAGKWPADIPADAPIEFSHPMLRPPPAGPPKK